MKIFNINSLQTLLSVVLAIATGLLTQLGCVQDVATAKLVCTVSNFPWLTPTTLGSVAGVVTFLKLVVLPWLQPGGWLHNLFGQKVAVVPAGSTAATPGTVSPVDVR